jgi:putative endonuclease
MAYLYVLTLCNGKYYIGSTENLERRFLEHKNGLSPYTKYYLPVQLIFMQEYKTKFEASKAEHWLKKQKDHSFITRVIKSGKLNKSF